MLSIQPLKSAQGAADYYAAAFNYYAGDAQALRWLGQGSVQLGLSGTVQKEQMLALLEGKLPNGQTLKNKKGEHRPGFDMTFSAPKSVSILSGLGADPNLSLLHDKAVEKALRLIEKEFSQARVVIQGRVHYVDTGNLVVAAFRQPSSRANDPALHTHCVTLNITFTPADGKARSLASDINGHFGVVEQLQQHVTYAGLLYRTELANLLKEQGYRLRDVGKGMFEIDGIPEEVLKAFSTRRQAIEEKMQEEGWEGARLASKATLLTRNAKEEYDMAILQADWKQRAEQLGFDASAFITSHKDLAEPHKAAGFLTMIKEKLLERFYGKQDLTELRAKEAVFVAIETLSQQTSVFEVRQLKEAALKHSLTGATVVPIAVIDRMIETHIKNGLLYQAIDPITKRSMLTTPWALTIETETLARIESNQGLLKPIANPHAVLQAQKNHETNSPFPLTASQKSALMHVFTSIDRFNAVQGYAGTGKTTMLQLTKALASDRGWSLRGLAVTSSAVNELRDKAGIRSDVFPIVHQELLNASRNSLKNTLYVLDEASMLSTIQGHELIKLIEQKGARLLLTGDDDQLSSVKCGRIFGQAQSYGMATVKMTDIIRQTNDKTRGAVRDAINRECYESIQKLDEVREFKTHDERIEAIAHHWLNLSHSVRERTLVFAPTHANRHDITHIIRQNLKKEGTLTGQEYVINTLKPKAIEEVQYHHTQYYQQGDVLRFNLKLPKSRIQSGDYLTVGIMTATHQKNNTIPLINREGRSVTLYLRDLPQYKPTRAGLNRPIEFYEATTLSLCVQDKVLITRNNNQAGLVNSSLASVKAMDEKTVTLCFEKNNEEKTFPLDANELQHLDHGYVLTNMKVQGKDRHYALGLIESYNQFSATLRNYYVQISRAISRMTLITDDKNQLLKALEYNDDTKKSALDYVNSDLLTRHNEQFANHPKAMDVNAITHKKAQNDEVVKQKQTLINHYSEAKEKQKTAPACKIAWQIATDETLRRMARHQLGISESVIRQDALKFATMKWLNGLSTEEREKALTVKAYLNACLNTQKAWKSVHDGNRSPLQKSKATAWSETRNALAHRITERIEEYKTSLHHFSIGKLNRLGISQYRIGKGEERAYARLHNLSVHAEKHQKGLCVASFFKEEDPKTKESLALVLKNQSKAIHPHLIRFAEKNNQPLDGLWREINQQARRREEDLFREGLNLEEQALFDTVKTYQSLNKELALHYASSLYALETGKELPEAVVEAQQRAATLRNQIAANLLDNPSANKVLSVLKVDENKLLKQAANHDKRETVLQFQQSASNFKQKKETALVIALDIKGHYPFIKELGVNTNSLNAFMRIEARSVFINELNEAQKRDFRNVMQYKLISQKASSAWKRIFSLQAQGQGVNEHRMIQAQQLTAKRDSVAFYIHQNASMHGFCEREKLDLLKIEQHAKQHGARQQTLIQLNETKDKLFKQLESRADGMSKLESAHWHKAWAELKTNLHRLAKKEALYHAAIGEPKKPLDFTDSQKLLMSRYELNNNSNKDITAEKTTGKTLPGKTRDFIDATTIIDALTENPIETYRAIFGEPKKITSKEMRFSGGLIVSLKGKKAGFWYDFSEGHGGNPLSAIMKERGLSFQDALREGAAIAGISGVASCPPMRKEKPLDLIDLKEEKNKIISAKSILKGGIPISGTLAEAYLKVHRGIENPEQLNVLFWPKGALWKATDDNGNLYEKTNKIPALLIAAKNAKGEITGVQRIYLDEKTGRKNTFMETAKLSKGKIEGSAGLLQKGEKFGTLYLAEGPETGATLAMANPKASVLVSFGLSNLKNLNELIKKLYPSEVIIAGDNDSAAKNDTLKITEDARAFLATKGIISTIIIPNTIAGRDKTDWNDVHQLQGLNQVKQQLGLMEEKHAPHKTVIRHYNEQLNQIEQYVKHFADGSNLLPKMVLPEAYSRDHLKSIYSTIDKANNAPQKVSESKQIEHFDSKQKSMDMEI
ncbi:conjugative transfer relaxase protein TraI [Legionella quinlivanii DSM 21216]|uniref:MobF family relaxase n=1 Tax=Legionella quinlivanii TaxID=45073 RepID=UPI00089F4D16|nr:MobF family relaxase [Legionella quinlivanii]SEG42443.1 conjugative transfer relaxase protein TraI [Legionella quinlivanii DSM 21216]